MEEVSVELGFMVRVAITETLADRIPSTHASRSSSLAVSTSQSRSSEGY